MKADFNTTYHWKRCARYSWWEFSTEFASHNKSPTLKGMFRSLVPRHVEETSNASADLCSSRNRRERRTSPTDPASSSPGSFYVTALWSSCASSPTLNPPHFTHTSDKPQRTQTHCFLPCMHALHTVLLYLLECIISALASTCNLLKVFYFLFFFLEIITWVHHTCTELVYIAVTP